MATVAFLGTGLLGSGMVERMLQQGNTVVVWNRTTSKARALEPRGARVAATPADAVADADRVHMTLPDDAIVDHIMYGFRGPLRNDAIVIDRPTPPPRGTAPRIQRVNGAGIQFLHAPVFMSPHMARDGVGILLASG